MSEEERRYEQHMATKRWLHAQPSENVDGVTGVTGVSANPNTERDAALDIEYVERYINRLKNGEPCLLGEEREAKAALASLALLARALRLASERIVSLRQTSPFTRIATDEVPLAVESVQAGLLREAAKT